MKTITILLPFKLMDFCDKDEGSRFAVQIDNDGIMRAYFFPFRPNPNQESVGGHLWRAFTETMWRQRWPSD